jgi:DNA polymerase-3 subunit epsilon
MLHLKLKKPLVFFDLETTGLDIVRDRIIEYAFVKVHPNGKEETMNGRLNPEMPIPIESSMVHGIYDEDVAHMPTFKQIAKNLAQFLEGCDLAGFNIVHFDIPILVEEFLRAGVEFSLNNRHVVDAQRIFHLMEPRTLSAAYRFYCGEELEDAHSAEADARATLAVLNAQVRRYEGKKIKDKNGKEFVPVKNDIKSLHDLSNTQRIDLAGRFAYNDKGEEVFNFGKYKGKAIVEVLKKDPGYYSWFMEADFPLESKQKLTEIKLRAGMNGKL